MDEIDEFHCKGRKDKWAGYNQIPKIRYDLDIVCFFCDGLEMTLKNNRIKIKIFYIKCKKGGEIQ